MHNRGWLIVLTVLAVIILASGCSRRFVPQAETGIPAAVSPSLATSPIPANGLTQSDDGGQVTIDVKWLGASGGTLSFAVAMNTHSVNLDGYDLVQMAVLRDDAGKEYHPTTWDAASGEHHRRGNLTFPLPEALSQDKARYLEMTISGIAGVGERVLRWEMAS
ncbi:MAG: hypothetical protein V1780_01605 [Chloroflexota bacterium]